jgi:hypothetical protein
MILLLLQFLQHCLSVVVYFKVQHCLGVVVYFKVQYCVSGVAVYLHKSHCLILCVVHIQPCFEVLQYVSAYRCSIFTLTLVVKTVTTVRSLWK